MNLYSLGYPLPLQVDINSYFFYYLHLTHPKLHIIFFA